MPNILDIRRRIRSVNNTRQITKAMKMVSAAKLRRAQERALAARPYAQMLTNVLKSLVSRAEIYDPETGEAQASAAGAASGEERSADRGHRRQGMAGAFNTNILKAASAFHRDRRRTRTSRSKPSAAKGAIFCAAVIPTAEPQNGRFAGVRRKPPSSASRSAS